MTQKEYKQEINRLNMIIEELTVKLNRKEYVEDKYKEVLEKYYQNNEQLKMEQDSNRINCRKINELENIIQHYQDIMSRVTITG